MGCLRRKASCRQASLGFRFLIPILAFFILGVLPEISSAQRNLGIPVREPIIWGTYLGPGKTGKMDTIYLSFGQYDAPLFLLAVNPDTGEMRQFNGPLSSEMGSWGFTVDHEDRIYLGSYYNAHLLRFDPKTEKWDDLGQPAGGRESFICSLTTAPDGKIWGGTYPSAKLFSYDPKTGVSEDFDRMDPEQFYCYPTAGDDGLIYCAIQFAKMDIVVFDPEKKTKTSLVAEKSREPGRVTLVKGKDGKIYSKLSTSDRWFLVEEGKRLVEVSRSDVPFVPKVLPDGRIFYSVDNNILRVEDPVTKERKEIPLRYEAAGTYIFVVGKGPDEKIYGSSMLPLRLFVYDPRNNSLANLGKASHATGEIYSMSSLNGKLYLCSYPEARLSVYDPSKPLRFGDSEDSNPRDLGLMGEELYRPRAMITGPHGNVYIGGYPDYGLLGGAIGVYDPERNEKRVAIRALGMRGRANNSQLLAEIYGASKDNDVKREIIRSLIMARDVDQLLNLAKTEPSADLRIEAIRGLGTMRANSETYERLASLYTTEKAAEIREQILRSMLTSGNAERAAQLAKQEADAKVRASAVRSLGMTDSAKTGDALVQIYKTDKDPGVKKAVIGALYMQQNARALVDIARQESDPTLKKEIVSRLSTMKAKEATDYMLELLK